jgi:hypothetical protein
MGGNQRKDEDDEEGVSSYWIYFEQKIILEIKILDNRSTSLEKFFLEWTMDQTDVSH